MTIEELRAELIKTQDELKKTQDELKMSNEEKAQIKTENQVLKEYNQKFFERIPKTLVENTPNEEIEEKPARVSLADFKNNLKKEINKNETN